MKHPILDRILMLLCAVCALCASAGLIALLIGKLSLETITAWIAQVNMSVFPVQIGIAVAAALLVLLALLLISAMLPARRKRSSTFAVQRNENGLVRISLKALETLVQKCLNQHAELKVVTSSLFSDEETIRVDIHIALQSDISMPLAISALQKQIKKYIEACSGVMVQEVRVFVDSSIPATEDTAQSPYAIPASLLGMETLPVGKATEEVNESAEMQTPVQDQTPADASPMIQSDSQEQMQKDEMQADTKVETVTEEDNEEPGDQQ